MPMTCFTHHFVHNTLSPIRFLVLCEYHQSPSSCFFFIGILWEVIPRIGTAYVDAVYYPDAAESTHMLSYTWSYKVGDIVDTLSEFCNKSGLASLQVAVWM